jgi:hypothetical protein
MYPLLYCPSICCHLFCEVFWGRRESAQFFYRLLITVLLFEIHPPQLCAYPTPGHEFPQLYLVVLICVKLFEVTGDCLFCLFCWYWWNCWPSLFKLFINDKRKEWQNVISKKVCIQYCKHNKSLKIPKG